MTSNAVWAVLYLWKDGITIMSDRENLRLDLVTSENITNYLQSLLEKQSEQIESNIINKIEEQIKEIKVLLDNNETKFQELLKRQNAEETESLKKKLQDETRCKEEAQKASEEKDSLLKKRNKEIDSWKNRNEELNKSLEEKKKNISELESQKEKNKDEIARHSQRIYELEEELKTYKQKYSVIDEALSKYQALSQASKTRIHNIFESDSIYSIVGACYDWRNIEGVWDFAKRRIVEKETNDEENLVFLFEFLLNAYNEQCGQVKYELIKPRSGEKFDSDLHSIIGIQTDGFVSAVSLAGIKNAENGRVIQKALIEV